MEGLVKMFPPVHLYIVLGTAATLLTRLEGTPQKAMTYVCGAVIIPLVVLLLAVLAAPEFFPVKGCEFFPVKGGDWWHQLCIGIHTLTLSSLFTILGWWGHSYVETSVVIPSA